MRDFNFFSPYIDQNKKSKNNNILIFLSIIIIIISMCGFILYTNMKIKKLEEQKAKYEGYLNSKKVVKELKKVNEKKAKVEIMKNYYNAVSDINIEMSEADKINTVLMDRISSKLPTDLFLKSMNIDGVNVNMQGVAMNRTCIGELEYNLKQLGVFDLVHISNISKESDESENFTFALKCTLKGGEK
ncbi:MAG: PilN domain-containing protein [Tepidibacter sp.]|jgi:type IV pilus assembly protein PilN|uniref:PilN domain-containing protein n=1 Tax=Tepidibacter sp. TaxID=2529387 RepID=UPI0025E1F1CC|nr:PilN domain-containing protein [Tepidibacter sp.]MCT4509433.1 PilN domain-containing protein [Tepidibacter sp.]